MSDTSLIFNILAKDRASAAFAKVANAAKVALIGIGVAAVGFGVKSVQAYSEAEQSQLKLQDAFAKFPALADTNIERLRALNSALALKTKFDDDATATGQASLAMFKFTGTQIEQLTPLLQDFAAKTGMDMDSAAKIFGKAMLGQGRGLKAVGINFKDTGTQAGNYAELMQGLRDKVGGFAEKEGKTAAGQTEILKNQFGELEEKVGGMLVPQLLKLVPVLKDVLNFMDRNASTIIKVGAVLGTLIGVVWAINMAVKAYTAVQIALNIAMSLNPIGLIIIAVIALVAVFVILWMKSAAFRNFFIGIWQHIWGFLKMVGAWFAGPFVNFFKRAWSIVSGLVVGYYKLVFTILGKVVSFVGSLPGKITKLSKGMWDGIVHAFKGAINWLIRLWNSVDFGINIRVPDWVPGIGGKGFSVPDLLPDLPMLAAGGIVTRPTVAMLGERGTEAVIPLSRAGFGQPVQINGSPILQKLVDEIAGEVRRRGGRLVVLGLRA